MNIIFMRHGEATDNVKQIISDKEIYWSTLTTNGKKAVLESITFLPTIIDKIYVSPFPRTIETAHFLSERYPSAEAIINQKLHEIYYGKYSGKKNNPELDHVRMKQIDNDYFIRLGQYGENRYDIELRLCEFLNDIYVNNFSSNTVVIVSHGTIISYMKRILNIKTPHIKTGKVEEFIDVDFAPLFKCISKLKTVKSKKIKERFEQINKLQINVSLKKNLIKLSKKEFNNIEFSDNYFSSFMCGMGTQKIKQQTSTNFENGVILVCFYKDFENFAKKWMDHYINIGIKNFVLIDNNSMDNSTKILKEYENKVNISFWSIDDDYDCYKMCGWKQQIFEFYGANHKFLTVDSDELLIYENYKNITFEEFLERNKLSTVKSIMLDVYTDKNLFEGEIEDFKYVDKGTYKITSNVPYFQRFYGGPRSRVFGVNPGLQKIPLISYTGKQIYVNNHYYYPWNINSKAKFCTYLLHYKFLPGDAEKYTALAKDKGNWNNSHEYKTYYDIFSNGKVTFYDKDISIAIDDLDLLFKD